MKTTHQLNLLAAVLVSALAFSTVQAQQVPIPQTAAEVPGPALGPMTPAYVQMVGRMAYVWGWPLLAVHNQAMQLTKVPEPGLLAGALPIGPMNQVAMATGYLPPGVQNGSWFTPCPKARAISMARLMSRFCEDLSPPKRSR